jgi:hypothetical protein
MEFLKELGMFWTYGAFDLKEHYCKNKEECPPKTLNEY